ncbi:putative CRISPR-associated protein [Methanobacterium virus PhiF3]|nr:putative CRISPR-associated protein [Methanobacterium virus PhiF3]
MVDYIITRHPATVSMVVKKMKIDKPVVIPHLTGDHLREMKMGDRVYGVLPIHLLYKVLMTGAHYYAIVLPDVPHERRGEELTEGELKKYGFRLLKVDEIYLREV